MSIVTVHLDAGHSPTIVEQIIDALRNEYGSLDGFMSADVLASTDDKTLALVSEWRDVDAWSTSRYDPNVGRLLEKCFVNSTALAFEVYYRRSHFERPFGLREMPAVRAGSTVLQFAPRTAKKP